MMNGLCVVTWHRFIAILSGWDARLNVVLLRVKDPESACVFGIDFGFEGDKIGSRFPYGDDMCLCSIVCTRRVKTIVRLNCAYSDHCRLKTKDFLHMWFLAIFS